MDAKLRNIFEKLTRAVRTPFILDEVTERQLDVDKGKGNYSLIELDLSKTFADHEVAVFGDHFTVEDCPANCTVKLNDINNDEIDLEKIKEIKSPFKKLYFNNTAGTGTLKILTGVKGMFYAKKKSENSAGASDFTITLEGSNYIAINLSTGNRDSINTDFSTVLQYCNDNIGTGGKITVVTDVVMDTGVSFSAVPILIDFTNHSITQSANSSVTLFTMNRRNWLQNVYFDMTAFTFTGVCVLFDGGNNLDSNGFGTGCSNLFGKDGAHGATLIKLFTDAVNEEVGWVNCRNITADRFKYGIHLHASGGAGVQWCNGNTFTDIFICKCEWGIKCEKNVANATAQVGYNIFNNIMIQSDNSAGDTDTNFYSNSTGNHFFGVIFDVGSEKAIDLTSDSKDTIYCCGCDRSKITDVGTDNMNLDTPESNIELEHINMSGKRPVYMFWDSEDGDNQYFYIAGYDTADTTIKYGKIRITATGYLEIAHQTGANKIYLEDNGDIELSPKVGGANYVDFKSQVVNAIAAETVTHYVNMKIDGVVKKVAIVS